MAVKTRKLNKKDFTKDGLRKLINRDIKEINKLSEQDLISLWSFFKCLCTDSGGEDIMFVTNRNSLIHRNKKILERNTKTKIELTEKMMAS
jgi:hypothetical protein